jgi:hypothetical protein
VRQPASARASASQQQPAPFFVRVSALNRAFPGGMRERSYNTHNMHNHNIVITPLLLTTKALDQRGETTNSGNKTNLTSSATFAPPPTSK